MHSDKDIFGLALLDYMNDRYAEDIQVHSPLMDDDHIPIPYLFRSYAEMPTLEQLTLDQTFGKVLDVGCCAGSHSLYLQEKVLILQESTVLKELFRFRESVDLKKQRSFLFWNIRILMTLFCY